jgi:hypothetical protein
MMQQLDSSKDITYSKLDLAKQCIQSLIPKLHGNQDGFGVVSFTTSAELVLPLQT